eukprot:gnl/MRDRNA2_/MRDRNA2_78672_c0_seq1.p1 gnl/MRDRNA2_/MRDRNA2_78672_c0~~gnl/MRDRNA2_/MRDRNA2_78672_c0_seq1.p1  ORF type:complete len:937 (-),score=182.69 gnl/MRDRNA2_/MRDRNA2_78672_c0_seq1:141-2576(-)
MSATTPLRLQRWIGNGWIPATDNTYPPRSGAWTYIHRIAEKEGGLSPGTLWRVVNMDTTTARWTVHEMEFHLSSKCNDPVNGTAVVSSALAGNGPNKLQDLDTKRGSTWVAGCPKSGCEAETEFFGLLIAESASFQCVRVYQAPQEFSGLPACEIVKLERWAGIRWETVRVFGEEEPIKNGVWASLIVLKETTKFSTDAKIWRVANDAPVEKHWALAELIFHDTIECNKPLVGQSDASGFAPKRYASDALDGDIRTFWWSQEKPQRREAWLGFTYAENSFVKCAQLLQSADPGYSTPFVVIQRKQGKDWLHIKSFVAVSQGYWQNLHVFESVKKPKNTMWRVRNWDPVPGSWMVYELEFYVDEECMDIAIGPEISSGYVEEVGPNYVEKFPTDDAFDINLGTYWWAPCTNGTEKGCSKGQAFVGQSFSVIKRDPKLGEIELPRTVDVQCAVIYQGDGPMNASSTLVIEKWGAGGTFVRANKYVNVPMGEYVKLKVDGVANFTIDKKRKELMLAVTVPPDLQGLQLQLSDTADSLSSTVVLEVNQWPLRLIRDREMVDGFVGYVQVAVQRSLAARTRQPALHVFVDLPELVVNRRLQTEEERPGSGPRVIARFVVYVTDYNETYGLQQSLDNIVADTQGTGALLLLDNIKTELRFATRLDPPQFNIITQIESELSIQLTEVTLQLAVATTLPPTTTLPPPPPEEPPNLTWLYLTILGSIMAFAGLLRVLWGCRHRYLLMLEERELWAIAHPGEEQPKFSLKPGFIARFQARRAERMRERDKDKKKKKKAKGADKTVPINHADGLTEQKRGEL